LITLRYLLCALLLLWPANGNAAEKPLLLPGKPFPDISLSAPQAPQDRSYLRLGGSHFVPSQIDADLLLIELLNVHCPHCQMQAPAYNELFRLIEENPETRGKIKMLGFAVGNLPKEVNIFRQAYQVPFPIIADPGFALWRAVGGSATPLTIYVRQDRSGRTGVVAGTHLGMNTNYRQLYRQLQLLLATDPAALRQKAQSAADRQSRIKPILSAAEIEYRVRTEFTRLGGIIDFSKLSLLSGRQVFTALIQRAGGQQERLFAEVASRSSVCDVCHDVHFIYLFDRSARVISFEPLQLTKYGNVNWNQQEVAKMRKRVVGHYLTAPTAFDPEVDAISSATMTSAIIFDSLAQGEEILTELRQQGLL